MSFEKKTNTPDQLYRSLHGVDFCWHWQKRVLMSQPGQGGATKNFCSLILQAEARLIICSYWRMTFLNLHILQWHFPDSASLGRKIIVFNEEYVSVRRRTERFSDCIAKWVNLILYIYRPKQFTRNYQIKNKTLKFEIQCTEKIVILMIYKTNPLIEIYLYFSFACQYTLRNSYQHKIYVMFSNILFSQWLKLDICSFYECNF